MKRITAALIALSLLTAACGTSGDEGATTTEPGSGPPSTIAPPSGDPDQLILRIGSTGGFVPIDFFVNETPLYELYADGTLYFQGISQGQFPGPVLNTLQKINIGDDLLGVLDLVQAIGLPSMDRESNDDAANFVADAANTVVLYRDADGDHIFSVYALGIDLAGSGVDPDPRVAALSQLVAFLNDLTINAAGEPYEPDRLQLFILPAPDETEEPGGEVLDWPLGDVTPADFAPTGIGDWLCTVVDADPDLVDTLAAATQVTRWRHEDGTFVMKGRGLLPAESGCEPLFDL